jgi:DNA-binding Xre family transcriptional regulator
MYSQYTETIASPRPVRRVVLRVREIMASRSIRSAAELRRRLSITGVEISDAQLLRIIDNKSPRVNMTVVSAMLHVLDCSVHELFGEAQVDREVLGETNA